MAISYVVDIYRRQLEPAAPARLRASTSRSSPTCWPVRSCAASELLPQIRRRRDPDAVDYSRAFWLILAGLFKKVVISSYVVERHRDAGLHVARASTRRPRRSSPPGATRCRSTATSAATPTSPSASPCCSAFRFPQQLRRALHGAQPAGLLAPLAHDAVALAARLPLHPARRAAPAAEAQTDPQHHDHHGAGRPLARRRLDVRGLGGAARASGRLSGTCAAPAGCGAGLPAVADGPVRVWVQRFLTFQFVCLGWVFFNATGHVAGLRRPGSHVHAAGVRRPRWSRRCSCVIVLGTHRPRSTCPARRVGRLQATFSRQRVRRAGRRARRRSCSASPPSVPSAWPRSSTTASDDDA